MVAQIAHTKRKRISLIPRPIPMNGYDYFNGYDNILTYLWTSTEF